MTHSIPDFSKARILVVGDVMLDSYWFGQTSRISPEAPVPVVHVARVEERPGGAGNVALNISELGASVTLLGLTGDDEAAGKLEKLLQERNVLCHFHRLKDFPTVNKLRVMSKNQQLIRLDFESGFDADVLQQLQETYEGLLSNIDVVVLSDYGKGVLVHIQKMIGRAREKNIPVLVDPKGSDFSAYRGAHLITPNLSELEAVVGLCDTDDELITKGTSLLRELDLQALLVTRSEKGMCLLSQDDAAYQLPTRAKEVFDVTGAGDTVISVFAAALAINKNMKQAASLANIAAGIVVAKVGTATASISELEVAIAGHSELSSKILTMDRLKEKVVAVQQLGERVVMTNGCFDILHAGHIKYLQQAREYGSRLIIAVNDDESVSRLKGSERPLNNLDNRMTMLAALACVDWVVPFSNDTPEELICHLLPDVLIKGGDYQPKDIAGYDCVVKNGGDVKVVDHFKGLSTTNLVKKIRKDK
ncbi:ADP-heptose synthase / D-glycero-beta-D-manno-heptose 7-phosphate kinase [hydrothermal vent metagenome]|uniref:D-glycero-beta-D-manno-heptose 1-phosphate adenylyltransferase n=1 Tax=hydrothermal vent metagenome TaxID=652676 RepID=A0A3B0YC19_9ZZZZ